MPTDNLPSTGPTSWDLGDALSTMQAQLNISIQCMIQQNVQDVEKAVLRADATYAQSKLFAAPDDLLLLDVLKQTIRLYLPLTRVLAFQIEGRFPKAREQILKGRATIAEACKAIDAYAQMPEAIEEVVSVLRPTIELIDIMFDGLDAYIQADIVGYQGDVRRYVALLHEAVSRFLRADQVPASPHDSVLALFSVCSSMASRLETRAEVFANQKEQPRPAPTGERIFIVHGHDEAKWRELRDLLEDRLKLKTVVLKEEPGAGETLIRKFEEYAAECCFAFVLFTPDDFVEKSGTAYCQARPNVLFELGWFYGNFGRNRVCIVKQERTAMPSDLGGILSIEFRDKVAEGYIEIENELRRAGVI